MGATSLSNMTLSGNSAGAIRTILVLIYWCCAVKGFTAVAALRRPQVSLFDSFSLSSFGRNAGMWPPTNEDASVKLEDSFPGGIVPSKSQDLLPPWLGWKAKTVDQIPAMLALALLLTKTVASRDVLLVSFASGYFIIVHQWSHAMRTDGTTPILPGLPPGGFIPATVANPLGVLNRPLSDGLVLVDSLR